MHDANLVVVHAFGSGSEADMAKGALEAAGIDAMIQADSAGGMRPHLAWASGGFKVLVREEDVDAARDVLEPPSEVGVDDQA
jgi:3-isopropylmalate dehydratase small subunit